MSDGPQLPPGSDPDDLVEYLTRYWEDILDLLSPKLREDLLRLARGAGQMEPALLRQGVQRLLIQGLPPRHPVRRAVSVRSRYLPGSPGGQRLTRYLADHLIDLERLVSQGTDDDPTVERPTHVDDDTDDVGNDLVDHLVDDGDDGDDEDEDDHADLFGDSVVTPPLAARLRAATPGARVEVVLELRSDHWEGVDRASARVRQAVAAVDPRSRVRQGRSYIAVALTPGQVSAVLERDGGEAVSRAWPNARIKPLIHRSVTVTKAAAVHRAFGALGAGVVWAVIDSGIDASHAHFAEYDTLALPDGLEHRSFLTGGDDEDPLLDPSGHGTHVAGIIAGGQTAPADRPLVAGVTRLDAELQPCVTRLPLTEITGMAPQCTLVSYKVLGRDRQDRWMDAVLHALEHVRAVNDRADELLIHGVNLSLGHELDLSWQAAASTPMAREVDRLVRNGVVVVVAAGNDGRHRTMTINHPGAAERAITVGSTSNNPYRTGVSHFSSKGPTLDGRTKPDLVAPGEQIVSVAAGQMRAKLVRQQPAGTYVDESGTSQAAAHVSGIAAAFLSVHQEFVGRPDDVRRALLDSASDLGRAPTFQGRGLVDALRALQAV
jgi:subtilisin family serine protease